MSSPTQLEIPVRQLPSLGVKSAAVNGDNDSNRCADDLHTYKRQCNEDDSSCRPKRAKRETDGEPERGGSLNLVPSSNEGKARALALRQEFVA